MSKLTDIVRYENANSTLAFRAVPFDAEDREALLIDVLALANARASGPRILVLGVRDEVGGKRGLKGVKKKNLAPLIAAYQATIDEFVEPQLSLSMRTEVIQGRTLAVITLQDCAGQPYVLKKNLSQRLRKGDGWIRKGTHQTRIGRVDLESMFSAGTITVRVGCKIQVVFEGSSLSPSVELPVLPLSNKPSVLARRRIHSLLEAKQAAHERLGKTDTWLDRLAFARVHGADQPYETQSPVSLLTQLAKSDEENKAADQYYENELRAHKINLTVANSGDGPLNSASIVVEIPEEAGVSVAERIYTPVGAPSDDIAVGYPAMKSVKGQTRIVAQLGRIDAGARLPAFRQPIRLLLREPAASKKLSINYQLFGKELREPMSGSLTITVTASDEQTTTESCAQ